MLKFLSRWSGAVASHPDVRMTATGCSARGRRRNINQDAWDVDEESGVLVVADGIGGGSCGEIASRMAVANLVHELKHRSEDGPRARSAEVLRDAFDSAAESIRKTAESRKCRCMGTTAVVAILDGATMTVGWAGDSRALLLRDGVAQQLTSDQTIAQKLADERAIPREAVATHAFRNTLWNFVGLGEVSGQPEMKTVSLRSGDIVILASDGVTGSLQPEELLHIATSCPGPGVAAKQVVRAALDAGSVDDVTCVIAFVEDV